MCENKTVLIICVPSHFGVVGNKGADVLLKTTESIASATNTLLQTK